MRCLPWVLLLTACGTSTSDPAEESPASTFQLVLFADLELPLGQEMKHSLEQASIPFALQAPGDFDEAFGRTGRLGLAWLDADGAVMSLIPGFATVEAVNARSDRVTLALQDWHSAGERERIDLQLSLRAEPAAERAARRLLTERPNDPDLRARLAHALVLQGSIQEAAVTLRAESTCKHSALTRGWVALAGRNPTQALEHCSGLTGAEACVLRGVAQHHQDLPEATTTLGSVLSRYPHSPWRADAAREIEHILQPPDSHSH